MKLFSLACKIQILWPIINKKMNFFPDWPDWRGPLTLRLYLEDKDVIMGKRELNLLLGLRLSSSSPPEACRSAERFLEEIASLERGARVPVHWNFSFSPLLESNDRGVKDLFLEMRARKKACGDVPLPEGFRGAIHPLLTLAELEKEIGWCNHNPWLPGCQELFAHRAEMLLPAAPDLQRELSLGVYSRWGIRVLAVPSTLGRPRRQRTAAKSHFRLQDSRYGAALVSCTLLSCAESLPLLDALPSLLDPVEKTLFLVLDPPENGGETGVLPLVQALERRFRLQLRSLADPATLGGLPRHECDPAAPQFAPQTPPVLRRRMALAEPLRSKKKLTNLELRRILELFGPTENGRQSPPSAPQAQATQERLASATMSGSVVLYGPSFEARFQTGRLAGIWRKNQQLLGGELVRAYLTVDGHRHPFQPETAYSFETEGETGLRALFTLRLAGQKHPGRLIADYYFKEGRADLFLDFHLLYPGFSPASQVQEVACPQLPLFALRKEEQATVQAFFPDGSHTSHRFQPSSPPRMLYGSRFCIRGGEHRLWLAFCGPLTPRIGCLLFHCGRTARLPLLSVNLSGARGPAEAAAYDGRTESCSFRLGLEG